MAGGGIKRGITYGETDDFGYNVVRDPVHVHDFHATMLHLLGIDHERLHVQVPGPPLPPDRRARQRGERPAGVSACSTPAVRRPLPPAPRPLPDRVPAAGGRARTARRCDGAPARRGSPRAFPLLVVAAMRRGGRGQRRLPARHVGRLRRRRPSSATCSSASSSRSARCSRRSRRGAASGPGPAMRIVRAGLALTLAALTVAGHLGATLTHGEGYLTEFAPAPLRTLIAGVSGAPAAAAFTGPVERAPVYPTLVRPVLQRHCVSCHAAGAARGGLVLDTPEAILKGGDHGPVVAPGRALASELVRRVWLPADHPDAMPPRGQRPLPAADAGLLRWWIDSGASFEQPLARAGRPARRAARDRSAPRSAVARRTDHPAGVAGRARSGAARRDPRPRRRPAAHRRRLAVPRGARQRPRAGRGRRTRRQPRAARAARPVADAGRHGDLGRRLPRHRRR